MRLTHPEVCKNLIGYLILVSLLMADINSQIPFERCNSHLYLISTGDSALIDGRGGIKTLAIDTNNRNLFSNVLKIIPTNDNTQYFTWTDEFLFKVTIKSSTISLEQIGSREDNSQTNCILVGLEVLSNNKGLM